MKSARYEEGLSGEVIAEKWLTDKLGMQCLARRYRAGKGEIDLIMQDGSCLVFVEVKARPTAHAGAGLMAVTPDKQRRMANAAMHYVILQGMTDAAMRFDVIELTADGILHIPDAFSC